MSVIYRVLPSLIVSLAILSPWQSWAASPPERWQATSTTASSITGDVTFTSDKITFGNGRSLALTEAGRLPSFTGMGHRVEATLYRVLPPLDLVLSNGNRLCGGRQPVAATFVVVWRPPRSPLGGDVAPRSMAVFSGTVPPNSDTGPGACGTFNYEASRR